MKNLMLLMLLIVNINAAAPPKEITGKWKVVNTDVSNINLKLTDKEKPMMLTMMKQIFTNGVFDFRANHQCTVTIKAPNMPQNLAWKYNADTGNLLISQANVPASKIMYINITEKASQVYFAIEETGLILTMQKQ
jgi:hypothetical protein